MSCLALALAVSVNGAVGLDVSDIMFVGYSSDGDTDDFSFVLFEDLTAGTEIRFTDHAWNGTAFDTSNINSDGEIVWTADSALGAGSVVRISMTTEQNTTATFGSVSGSFGSSNLSGAGDVFFAFQGSLTSPSFIHGLNYRGAYNTPAVGSGFDSLLPDALDVPNGNILVRSGSSPDNGEYTIDRELADFADNKALISDRNNWFVSDDDFELAYLTIPGPEDPGPVVPEPETYSLILGAAAFLGLAFRRFRRA
ncbi:MAG: PEP-CTERM sorting domain-containing protein [Verrucomicrobiota bacterium JB022]|nr:PEP-CTERM sorting domain-containing protein [Verrucomicrobiota bacterium JB022]